MSHGLNRAFRAKMRGEKFLRSTVQGGVDPIDFLRNNLFEASPHISLIGKSAGRYRFNFVKNGDAISIRLSANDRSRSSNTFRALWCPYVPTASSKIILSDQANYLFTPAITGGLIEINGEQFTHHGEVIKTGIAPRLHHLVRGGMLGHRKWDKGVYSTSVVFGVRKDNGWDFYQQSFNRGSAIPLPKGQVTQI
ncbi:MAG: hypothetical protein OEZ33_01995 [Gammaproteobacteria bacterium]|nr:hypothetical protein [Gammaproteobacteria bacterium]MDH5776957.1 hypothetical protein [Gammaproteobacteria bacterium]